MALRLRPITFYTADSTKTHNVDPNGVDWNDITYKMYDNGGVITTDPTLCVRTQIDFEPILDFYGLRGGWVELSGDLAGGTTDLWYLSAIGVPDIPAGSGGSIPFISEINLETNLDHKIIVDATYVIDLSYNGTYHTSKIRFNVKHPVGVSKRFQIFIEIFR